MAAARAAEADGFIAALPQGYDTVVGEKGLTLSGGQRQRVALARALLTDPAILVLDDATSAVDPQVEAEIHETLRRVMRGRTTLLIAHRRSTLQLADRIAVLDQGRLVDEGSHEELMARCPLYRLLLAGPGEDAEGVDAGELAYYADGDGSANGDGRVNGDGRPGPARSRLWPADAAPARAGRTPASTDAGGGFLAGIPASPELLAQVDALPPATDTPGVDAGQARAADPHFTLRRLLRPFAVAFMVGLVLDGLDALANLAMPALVRGGIDQGVEAQAIRVVLAVSAAALLIVLADWVITAVQTLVVGRNGERLLYTLRVKIFAHLQRLGLDFYERELGGRIMTRMTTDVEALSSFLQTGLISFVNSLLTFGGVLIALLFINLTLGLTVLAILPFAAVATVVVPARVVPRLRRRPGEGQRGQRRPAGERGRPAGVPGLPPGGAQRASASPGAATTTGAPGSAPSATSRCTSRSSSRCPPSPGRWSCWWRRARCAAAR